MLNLLLIIFLQCLIIIIFCYINNHKYYNLISCNKFSNSNSLYYLSKNIFYSYDKKNIQQWRNISICLFVPIHFASQEYISNAIKNYDVFWPFNIGKRVILIDKGYEYLETYITDKWEIHYEEYNVTGYLRRQYSSYIAYRYCIPNEYIAYMDIDSVFTMKVAKYMLFDCDNKPYFLYTKRIRYKKWNPLKVLKLNKTEWGDAMITFPVLIYTEHLIQLNEYLKKIHNISLENIVNNYFTSQFCVFLEFVKHFYNKKYHFAVYENIHLIRCAIHIPYAYNVSKKISKSKTFKNGINVLINKITYEGLCSIMIDKYPHKCSKFNINSFYLRFYVIDYYSYSKNSFIQKDILDYNNFKYKIMKDFEYK